MVNIGFSTGCFYGWDVSIDDAIRLISRSGANSIELSFPNKFDLDYNIDSDSLKLLKNFDYVSIHAPWKGDIDYSISRESLDFLTRIIDLASSVGAENIVIHPTNISDSAVLDVYNGLVVENMSSSKLIGTDSKYFLGLVENTEIQPRFVFDLQHAYSVDPSMTVAEELFKQFSGNIKEFHLSGFDSESNHVPICASENHLKIMDSFVSVYNGEPIILEGVIKYCEPHLIERELDYVIGMADLVLR
ncbi:MAG: hypothetical protein K0B02_05460 [DPANN group archaeon]|nr:hypothetical protein [DPANN group archaeon]